MSYICAYRIDFSDGGEPEACILHRGSKEECERTMELIPAISYAGPRPVSDCRIGVFEE